MIEASSYHEAGMALFLRSVRANEQCHNNGNLYTPTPKNVVEAANYHENGMAMSLQKVRDEAEHVDLELECERRRYQKARDTELQSERSRYHKAKEATAGDIKIRHANFVGY